MKKILKLFAWLLGTVVVVLVVIAAAVPFFFDPNDHKDRIAALARQHTGRDFKIEGDIALSIFPWLGVHLPMVEVGNAPGFPEAVFAHIEEMQMRVRLLPLFATRLEMDRLSVRGLVVNLARREDGVSNWDDLVARGATETDSPGSDAGAATAIALGGLDIRGATINWRDQQRKEHFTVAALDVQTGPLGAGAPVKFSVAFDLEERAAGIRGRVTTSGSVRLPPGGNTVHADNVTVQAALEGDALPGGKTKLVGRADASFDTASRRVSLSRLEVEGSGLTIADRPGRISVKGSLAGDLVTQTFRLPNVEVAADLGGRGDRGDQAEGGGGTRLDASGDVTISMDSDTLTVHSLRFAVPELDLAAASGALSGSADLSVNLESRSYTVSGMAASGTLVVNALQGKQSQFELKGAIDGNIATGMHAVQNLSLATVVRGSDLPGGELAATIVADLDIDANQHAISARNLRLETAGVTATGNLSARDLAGAPQLQGTLETEPFHPRKMLERLGVHLPATSDPKVLHSASIKTDFATSADSAKLGRMIVALDDSRISGNVAIEGFETPTLDFDLTVDRIDIVSLDAQLAGKSFPSVKLAIAARGRLEIDVAKQTLNSDGLEIGVGHLVTHSTVQITNLLGDLSYRGTLKAAAFNPRTVLQQLGQKDIVTADPKALSSAQFEARINGTRSNVNVESLALTLDRSKLDGTLGVANFADPAIRFDLNIDDLDADRYLPPQGKGRQAPAGTPGAALAVVPTETLRHLNLDGRLRIARMKLGNLRLSDIRVTAKAKDGIVNLFPLGARLYQGSYTGNVRVDARGKRPVLRLDERLEQVQLGPLLQDVRGEQPVTGLASLHATLTATGPDAETVKRTLSGSTRFVLANGEVKGLDLIGQLCALASTLSLTSVRRENIIAGILQLAVPQEARMMGGTPFTDLTGTVNFADGLASNDDLVLTSPVLTFAGRGSVNLTSLSVDYRGIARLTGGCADRVGRSFRELRGAGIPVHISGLASQPKVEANLAGLFLQAFDARGGRQARPSQPQAAMQPQQPPGVFGQGSRQSGQQRRSPAPPAQEQVIRGLLEKLLK